MKRKVLCYFTLLSIVCLFACGCESKEEKCDKAIQGNWYLCVQEGSYSRLNYNNGEYATYIGTEDGNETKMEWGTYKIEENKVVPEIKGTSELVSNPEAIPLLIEMKGDTAIKVGPYSRDKY